MVQSADGNTAGNEALPHTGGPPAVLSEARLLTADTGICGLADWSQNPSQS